jgi:xanthine dehydrogenase molybdenum-binding subunit
MIPAAVEMKFVGKRLPKVDALEKITMGGRYVFDLTVPDMLYGKILRSPIPHGRVNRIDASKLAGRPGIKAVLTHEDVPRIKFHPPTFHHSLARGAPRDMLILEETVRFVGDEVAAVAAISAREAEEALELIAVDYTELPFVLDPIAALADDAPKIHGDSNVAQEVNLGWGSVEDGFRQADLVFEDTYRTTRVSACPMEPHVSLCVPEPDGGLTVHSSTQHIHGLQERLAFALGLPMNRIRVVKPAYIGGGFGAKLDMNNAEAICALLALKSRRPVKIELTREEEFVTTFRNPIIIKLRTGVKRDGTFTARHAEAVMDSGGHVSHAGPVLWLCGSTFVAQYRSPNARFQGRVVYTNNPVGGGYRGYGGPQAAFAVEQHVDLIARELGMDPFELRLKNSWGVGEPNPMLSKAGKITSYAFKECVDLAKSLAQWDGLPAWKRRGERGTKRGVGVACLPIWNSGCLGMPTVMEIGGAFVNVHPDGSAGLVVATVDQGGGQNTVFAQIVAEILTIPPDTVQISAADSNNSPVDAPIHASRGTYSAGYAVVKATEDARDQILKTGAAMLEADPRDLELKDGSVVVKGTDRKVSIADVARRSQYHWPGSAIVGKASVSPPSNPASSAVQVALVEVDTESGRVRVLKVVSVHDVGKAINPAGVEGQVHGGVRQGLGYALTEDLAVHPETGVVQAKDLLEYKMLTAADMPEISVGMVESNEPTGPFGAKGVGEPPLIPVAAAVANAVHDALGIRVRELPITDEKVLRLLGKLGD